MKKKGTKPTSIRLTDELEKEIKKLAEKNMRSISNEIIMIIKEYLEKNKT